MEELDVILIGDLIDGFIDVCIDFVFDVPLMMSMMSTFWVYLFTLLPHLAPSWILS